MVPFPNETDCPEADYPRIIVPIISPADAEGGAYRPDFSHRYRSRRDYAELPRY
jgi:hypothetical protein